MDTNLQLLAPWVAVDDSESQRFEDEYAAEIAKGHPLYGVPVKAIARRADSNDVLFRLLRHLCDYAVVRLSWSGREELSPDSPHLDLYVDDQDLTEKRLIPDQHEHQS